MGRVISEAESGSNQLGSSGITCSRTDSLHNLAGGPNATQRKSTVAVLPAGLHACKAWGHGAWHGRGHGMIEGRALATCQPR